MNMTSNCDITKTTHQKQMTTICHWMKPPHEYFLRTPLQGWLNVLTRGLNSRLPGHWKAGYSAIYVTGSS